MVSKSIKVLIVDDSKDCCELFRAYFELSGCQVVTAEDGRGLIDLTQRTHPDLIVTDLELPGLSGPEAVAKIQKRNVRTPVFVMSGHDRTMITERCRKLRIEGILQKPFNLEKVRELVHKHSRGVSHERPKR